MKRISGVLCCIVMLNLVANAQTHSVKLLQHAIDTVNTYQHLYYKIKSVQKNPFSQNDTTITKNTETIKLNSSGNIEFQNILSNINNYQGHSRSLYEHDTLYNIDLKNHLYSVELYPKEISNSLTYFIKQADYAIKNKPSKIVLLKDTTINSIRCYVIFIKVYDTIENGNHNYTHQFFYINRQTLLPVYTKNVGTGNAEKDGYSLGRLNFFGEMYFYDYQFNKKPDIEAFYFDRLGFDTTIEKMLANRTVAPEILVRNLSNEAIPASYFKNKALLVEFGSTTCGANPLANPMLNRLSKKYSSHGIAVIGVYCEDTSDQVKNYISHNHIQFPIYLGDANLKASFQITGTPNFYLIDNSGTIIKAMGGYNGELEQQISEEIEKMNIPK